MKVQCVIAVITTFLRNLFIPRYCGACGIVLYEYGAVLCDACLKTIKPVVSYTLPQTGMLEVKVFAMSTYEGAVQRLIRAKNYGDKIAAYELGMLMAQHLQVDWTSFDYLVPVPLHWTRYIRRGFNQAEIIAECLSKKCGIPIKVLVKRKKRTAYQAHLDAQSRQKNTTDAFELIPIKDRAEFLGKHLVIIDDLMTTGATLTALVTELKKLKPARITVLVAARVL